MSEASAAMKELASGLAGLGQIRRDDILVKLGELFGGVSHLLPDDGVETFEAIFVSLIPICGEQAKASLSSTIASNERGPGRAVRHLAFDDSILVARPVLRLSPLLLDDHLLALATVKSSDHLLAMCQRSHLPIQVTDVILSRANGEILVALAENPGAALSRAGQEALAEAALDDGGLYDAMQLRPDLAAVLDIIEAEQTGYVKPVLHKPSQLAANPVEVSPAPASPALPVQAVAQVPAVQVPASQVQASLVQASQPAAVLTLPELEGKLRQLLESNAVDAALATLARQLSVPLPGLAKAFAVDIHGGFLAYAKAARLDWSTMLRFLMKRYEAGHITPRLQRAELDYGGLEVADARRVVGMLVTHAPKPN